MAESGMMLPSLRGTPVPVSVRGPSSTSASDRLPDMTNEIIQATAESSAWYLTSSSLIFEAALGRVSERACGKYNMTVGSPRQPGYHESNETGLRVEGKACYDSGGSHPKGVQYSVE